MLGTAPNDDLYDLRMLLGLYSASTPLEFVETHDRMGELVHGWLTCAVRNVDASLALAERDLWAQGQHLHRSASQHVACLIWLADHGNIGLTAVGANGVLALAEDPRRWGFGPSDLRPSSGTASWYARTERDDYGDAVGTRLVDRDAGVPRELWKDSYKMLWPGFVAINRVLRGSPWTQKLGRIRP